jgi:membrane-associated protein
MQADITNYISHYGYFAIFMMILLQELGAPNPIPNELVIISAGYTVFKGVLRFPIVMLTVISADIAATLTLHAIFYLSGHYLTHKKPKWLPLPEKILDFLKKKILKNGISTIYIGRLLPFIRGYTAVVSGLLQIKLTTYLPIAVITAIIWSVVYLVAGFLLGPVWQSVIPHLTNLNAIMFIPIVIVMLITIPKIAMNYLVKKTINS